MEQPVLRTRRQSAESETPSFHYSREERLSRAGKEFPWLEREGRGGPSRRAVRLILIDALLVMVIFSLYNTFWRGPGPSERQDGYRLQLVSPADDQLLLSIRAESGAAASGGVVEVRVIAGSASAAGSEVGSASPRILDAAPVPGGPVVVIPLPVSGDTVPGDLIVEVVLPTSTVVRLRPR